LLFDFLVCDICVGVSTIYLGTHNHLTDVLPT